MLKIALGRVQMYRDEESLYLDWLLIGMRKCCRRNVVDKFVLGGVTRAIAIYYEVALDNM